MTFGWPPDEVDALRTDRYLDALLESARTAADAPAPSELDPAVRHSARRLRRELVRVHPSFRFEEQLSRRLADAAATIDRAGGGLRLDRSPVVGRRFGGEPSLESGRSVPASLQARRPLLVGGAVASAAISLAGAAFVVARRRSRPAPPMRRAVLAAHSRFVPGRRASRARRVPLA